MARTTPEVPATRTLPRVAPARSVLLVDRLMAVGITFGGIAIIVAVLGIFVFILSQVLPLFRGARVAPLQQVALPPQPYVLLGTDEWTALPVLVSADGTLWFVDPSGQRPVQRVSPAHPPDVAFTAFAYDQGRQEVVMATRDGRFTVVRLNYQATFAGSARTVVAHPQAGPLLALGRQGYPITHIAYRDSGSDKLAVAIQDVAGRREVHAVHLVQRRTLLGASKVQVKNRYDLTPQLAGTPQAVAVTAQADGVVVATEEGDVYYFVRQSEALALRQVFAPFQDLAAPQIASMHFLLGGVSLAFSSPSGAHRLFSLYVPAGAAVRLFGQTKALTPLPAGASFFAHSLRNKAFLTGAGAWAGLYYATTATVRWQQQLPFTVTLARLGGKYDRLLFLDDHHTLHLYALDDPHPEDGWRAFFGKLWYEGAAAPAYVWQSTGGSDAFEPKLSLVPLIIGTLKGTFYALLFAVPVALLAAIYTSQFLHPNLRLVVKPTMEIMASLPSVILGFLAALWLAPLLERRIPSCLLIFLGIPWAAVVFGWLWNRLPRRCRRLVRPGYEFLAFAPVLLAVVYAAWQLGPLLERWLFVVTDPHSGQRLADFRLWWPQATGTRFEQRNALVVGFMMGFAVIPIIFTIAEDALSSVPAALKSASLALGASRWQTAVRVVIPTASAGIFSALMIGLGRAVGETMIVLMATGNTPIMDFSIFTGMRTLSANIAVELPEAPHHGTLYRTLFLGGLLLFVMTFLVNTVAEILRQHLRERYKTV
ncbi:MAG: ABC high affinity phosphate uptake system permease PstC [Candidatus Tectimicrobiota bacterium]|nr:MAG: ABC high affinity phosphate uptake system permease PstC [Candidatus Tectomicrobia bacterium]